MKPLIKFEHCRIEPVSSLYNFRTTVDVLRLDRIHPVISGNKWFKLKEYLQDAANQNKKAVVTFGGAFSNHIVATAAAAELYGLKSIGIIRGEQASTLSHTLKDALSYGMELLFVSREAYKAKCLPPEIPGTYSGEELYIINEGGYGCKGMEGAKDILQNVEASKYTHIAVAVGTGTTLAGLTAAAGTGQTVMGISALKNNLSLQKEINSLLPEEKQNAFLLFHDYHFGGYAKYTPGLTRFMNQWYEQTGIPSDFVYTGKLFFAVNDLLQQGSFFPEGSTILIVHSGGLQGNLSLPKGTLIF
jgi:1-aminocyclopropane-1-carboxylate deaminase